MPGGHCYEIAMADLCCHSHREVCGLPLKHGILCSVQMMSSDCSATNLHIAFALSFSLTWQHIQTLNDLASY